MQKRSVIVLFLVIFLLGIMPSVFAQGSTYVNPFTQTNNGLIGSAEGVWGLVKSLLKPFVEMDITNETNVKLLLGILVFVILGMVASKVMPSRNIAWVIAFILSLMVAIATPGKLIVSIFMTYAVVAVIALFGVAFAAFFFMHKQLKKIVNPDEHPRGYHMLTAIYYALLIIVFMTVMSGIVMLFKSNTTEAPPTLAEINSLFALILVILFIYHLGKALFSGLGGAIKDKWQNRPSKKENIVFPSPGSTPDQADASQQMPGTPVQPNMDPGSQSQSTTTPSAEGAGVSPGDGSSVSPAAGGVPPPPLPSEDSSGTVKCPNCGKENPATNYWCSKCGADLPRLKDESAKQSSESEEKGIIKRMAEEESRPSSEKSGLLAKLFHPKSTALSVPSQISRGSIDTATRETKINGPLGEIAQLETSEAEQVRALLVEDTEIYRRAEKEAEIISILRNLNARELNDASSVKNLVDNMALVIDKIEQFGNPTPEQILSLKKSFASMKIRLNDQLSVNEGLRDNLKATLSLHSEISKFMDTQSMFKNRIDRMILGELKGKLKEDEFRQLKESQFKDIEKVKRNLIENNWTEYNEQCKRALLKVHGDLGEIEGDEKSFTKLLKDLQVYFFKFANRLSEAITNKESLSEAKEALKEINSLTNQMYSKLSGVEKAASEAQQFIVALQNGEVAKEKIEKDLATLITQAKLILNRQAKAQ